VTRRHLRSVHPGEPWRPERADLRDLSWSGLADRMVNTDDDAELAAIATEVQRRIGDRRAGQR
jgi:hypothetical protein